MQQHSFAHNGHELAYYTAGSADNPPIIFVHGFTSSHLVWRTTIPLFETEYYCIAIDLLGHGNSEIVPNGDYAIKSQAERVLALADLLGLDDFALVGHSMGGQISMQLASVSAPDRVTKLVNVAGVVIGELTPMVRWRAEIPIRLMYYSPISSLLEAAMHKLSNYKFYAGYQYRMWFYDMNEMLARFDEWEIDRYHATKKGMYHTLHHGLRAIHNLDISGTLHQITAPTLVLFGTEDNTVPVGDGHLAAERIPNSELVLIDKCGHTPMFEKPAEYQQALRDFFEL